MNTNTSSSLARRASVVTAGIAALALPVALGVSGASAVGRHDRDHDGMPDRWERVHHLNPRHANGRADADHDGSTNLQEFRHHTDPRDADSDDDGVRDGRDHHQGHGADDGAGHDAGDDHGNHTEPGDDHGGNHGGHGADD